MLEQIYKNARAIPREGDYTDDQGMCLCGKCGKPRECFIEYPTGSRKGIIKAIPCQCEIEKEERYLQQRSLLRRAQNPKLKQILKRQRRRRKERLLLLSA